jgi:glycosyltransferase involved in cell wall biosynthesis
MLSSTTAPEAASAARPTVYVDAAMLLDRHLTGIGRYTARVALALHNVAQVRFFLGRREIVPPRGLSWDPDQDLTRWGRRACRGRRKPLGTPASDSIGLFTCLRSNERLFPFEVSVLYDFTQLVVPLTHTEETRSKFQRFFAETIHASDEVIAISHSTKADARWLCDFDQDRIHVVYPGPSLCVEHHLHTEPVERRPEVGLVVSTLEPRKNAPFVLDWFAATDVLPPNSELWWAGPPGWLTTRRRLSGYRWRDGRRMRFLGAVPDRVLCRLYQSAGWSIYASLYEGFGLPVLDALRHGTPVLTSGNSALWEFRGVPGVFFLDPCDASSVGAAYREMSANSDSSGQTAQAGRAWLNRRYGWDHVARAIVELGRSALRLKAESLSPAA